MNPLSKIIQLTKHYKNLNSSATRITKGMMAFSLSQLINFLVRIGLPPLYLHAWGIGRYGDWLILSSIVAYLSLSSLGGQLYIVNRLSQLFSQEKMLAFKKVFNSGLILFIILPGLALLLFAVAIAYLPMSTLLHIQHTKANLVKIVLFILASEILLSLPLGLLTGIYKSIGKLPTSVMLINAMTLAQVCLCAIALLLKANIVMLAVMHLLPVLGLIAIIIWRLPREFSFPIFSIKTVELKQLKTFIKPSLHFLTIELSSACSIQGIVIILGGILGSIQLVMFATMRTIINMMKQILSVVAFSAWREMTHYDAINHPEKLQLLFRSVLRTSLIAAMFIAILLYFFAAPLYALWLHHRVPFKQPLMNLFLLYGIEMVFWTACANLLMSINRHHILARVYFVSAITSLTAAYFAGHHFGLQGVIIALLLTDLIFPAWFIPYLVYRYNHRFNFLFFLRELSPILLGILLIPILPLSLTLFIPLFIYWWYRSLPLEMIKIHEEIS